MIMFKIGDVVKVKNEGWKYIVIENHDDVIENMVFLIPMEEYDFEHPHCLGNCIRRCFVGDLDKVGSVKTFKCARCGEVHFGKPFISQNGKYCFNCNSIESYSTENNKVTHTIKKHGKTYGFELECIPFSEKDMLFLFHHKYNLIPTFDASLDVDGVEFKTPTYYSLNGLKSMLHTFEKHVDFKNESCGQHINIGHTEKINYRTMIWIRNYADDIFKVVEDYMVNNPKSTEKICGRFFNNYCSYNDSFNFHTTWVNLGHSNRIEFRLAKIQSPEQYIQLVNMYGEWVDAIITWFLRDPNERNAKIAGRKLLRIFQKYERGDAVSQSRARNNRKVS